MALHVKYHLHTRKNDVTFFLENNFYCLRTDGGREMKRLHELAAYGVIHITGLRWSEGQGSAERRVKEVKTLLTRIVSSSHLDPASSKILLPQPNGQ